MRVFLVLTILVVGSVSAIAQEPGDTAAGEDALAQLGALLAKDWKDKPEWAEMATSVLKGERMGDGLGWFKDGATRYDWEWLKTRFDQDEDDVVSREEIGDALFEKLDRDRNNRIDAADFDWKQAPMDPGQQMARRLFYQWDRDSNGKLTQDELMAFFAAADKQQTGFVTPADLAKILSPPPQPRSPGVTPQTTEYRPGLDRLKDLQMLLDGEFGSLSQGPSIDDEAPDFELPLQGKTETVKLSELRGRPVVLVFGSFT